MDSSTRVLELLRTFQKLHEKRVQVYSKLSTSYKEYLFALSLHVGLRVMSDLGLQELQQGHHHHHHDEIQQVEGVNGIPAGCSHDHDVEINKPWEENFEKELQKVTLEFSEISRSVNQLEEELRSLSCSEVADNLRHIQSWEKEKLIETVTLQMKRREYEVYFRKRDMEAKKREQDREETGRRVDEDEDDDEEHWREAQKRAEYDRLTKSYAHRQSELINAINDQLEEIRYVIDDLSHDSSQLEV